MAEDPDTSVVTAEDGTGESQASSQGIEQGQVYTPEELRELYRGVIREENSAVWNEMRQQLTPLQQRLAELVPKIDAMLPQITEVQGDAKATRKLVKDVLAGRTLDEGQLQAINDAEQLEEQQRVTARQQREETRRQAELEEVKKGQLTPGQLRQIRFDATWSAVDHHLNGRAKEQGFRDFKSIADDIKSVVGSEIPVAWMVPGDEFGLNRWEEEARKAILAKAAAREADGNAQVNVPSLRGGGGQSTAQIWESYGQGDIPWSAKVQTAGKELGYI